MEERLDDRDPRMSYGSEWSWNESYAQYGVYQRTISVSSTLPGAATLNFPSTVNYVAINSLYWIDGANFTVTIDGRRFGPFNLGVAGTPYVATSFETYDLDPSRDHTMSVQKIAHDPSWTRNRSWANIDSILLRHAEVTTTSSSTSSTSGSTSTTQVAESSNSTSTIPYSTMEVSEELSAPIAPSEPDTASNPSKAGPIAGGVVGGLLILFLLFFFLRTRIRNAWTERKRREWLKRRPSIAVGGTSHEPAPAAPYLPGGSAFSEKLSRLGVGGRRNERNLFSLNTMSTFSLSSSRTAPSDVLPMTSPRSPGEKYIGPDASTVSLSLSSPTPRQPRMLPSAPGTAEPNLSQLQNEIAGLRAQVVWLSGTRESGALDPDISVADTRSVVDEPPPVYEPRR